MKSNGFERAALAALAIALLAGPPTFKSEEPSAAAVAGFNSYTAALEARLAQQRQSGAGFVSGRQILSRLRQGQPIVEDLTPSNGADLPGAALYDWRGTAFVPGATAAEFERLMRDFAAYPQRYAPQVVSARVLARDGDHYRVLVRVRQKHIVTVVMDTVYDVDFVHVDANRGFSVSRSTRISEIDAAGTAKERALSGAEEHGFLWRLNTYWDYEQRDGGLYMRIESVSLTRPIPTGLGWAIGPFVQSVPRESLAFTLKATRDALRN